MAAGYIGLAEQQSQQNAEGEHEVSVPTGLNTSLQALLLSTAESVDFDIPFKTLKQNIIQQINEFIVELEDSTHNIASQALEHIHSNEVIMTYGKARVGEVHLRHTCVYCVGVYILCGGVRVVIFICVVWTCGASGDGSQNCCGCCRQSGCDCQWHSGCGRQWHSGCGCQWYSGCGCVVSHSMRHPGHSRAVEAFLKKAAQKRTFSVIVAESAPSYST